ncbi:hypothetical protein [Achromobacter denitrificans]|uniref:hypothetical protein n=1 Tax=Achromobacter denitrificans TaxID=32002 RepID=UPI0029AFC165|nr:hypothetical protein [Achromobacter sp.]
MAITSLPAPPSRSDPENFAERADAFMAALPQFADQANTLQTEVNQTAVFVDNDAIAAAASSVYAEDRAESAQASAEAATEARQVATQKATDAGESAGLAEQWATKLGAPVADDRFSAKHYAQLAAQGAGLSVVFAENVPTEDIGPVFIVGQGIAEWDEARGAYRVMSEIPVGKVDWCPERQAIWTGWIPGDGQILNRATNPDLTEEVLQGRVPVVDDAEWLADPLKRGCYSLGDGATTIRAPDYNGKYPGSLGALVLRGDGVQSAGIAGRIQRDALQNMTGSISFHGASTGTTLYGTDGVFKPGNVNPNSFGNVNLANGAQSLGYATFDASRVARTATETRTLNVTGCFVIKAFGAVVNPGSVDAAQLASDLAALSAAFQTLDGEIDSIIYYPNGSAANPATIITNTRYVFNNPFPGHEVDVDVRVKSSDGVGAWFDPGWSTNFTSASTWASFGCAVSQLSSGQIVLQTGSARVAGAGSAGGGAGGESPSYFTALVQLRVRKMKGAV